MNEHQQALLSESLSIFIDDLRQTLRENVAGQPSRRERIATAALQGILAADTREQSLGHQHDATDDPEYTAGVAVRLADALIAELDKPAEAAVPV